MPQWPGRVLPRLLLASTALALLSPAAGRAQARRDRAVQPQRFDVLIRGGRILDGTGNPDYPADIGIVGDHIAAIGNLAGSSAKRIVDVHGKYVTPGFIDMHSHAASSLVSDNAEARKATNLVTQGITTVVADPDGRNARFPLSAEITALREQGIGLNVVPMVGHNTVRQQVMGKDYEREATPEEVARMQQLVKEAMEQGAWGLTAGLEYRPGRYSNPDEVVALARMVAPYGGFYAAHQRSEAQLPSVWQVPSMVRKWPYDGARALEETINIARQTGIPVVGSHIKAQGFSQFGRSAIDVALVDAARAEGLQVYLDQYPWDSYGGGRTELIPSWALVDDPDAIEGEHGGLDAPALRQKGALSHARDNLRKVLADPARRAVLEHDMDFLVDANGGAERILILAHPDSTLVGKSLADAARAHGKSVDETLIDFALTGFPEVPEGMYVRNRAMDDRDIIRYMRQPYTATSSDAGIDVPRPGSSARGLHPRFYGTFPRKIGHYARDLHAVSLPAAVRSATSLAAQIVGLPDRGMLREGYKADVVVFDYATIRDRATYLEPRQLSEGIDYVLENGVFTVDGGKPTGATPGVVLLRPDVVSRPGRLLSSAPAVLP